MRPEKIRLLAEDERRARRRASQLGAVREVVYLGSVTRYVVELDDGETLVALRQNLDTSATRAARRSAAAACGSPGDRST